MSPYMKYLPRSAALTKRIAASGNENGVALKVSLACVQTSPIPFASRGKGTFPRETKEIGDV